VSRAPMQALQSQYAPAAAEPGEPATVREIP
jgi:hypothetical protein